MNNIQGLTQVAAIYNKRYICFRSPLCARYYTDSVSTKSVKKPAGCTDGMLHIFTHNGNSGQIRLRADFRKAACRQFRSKLLPQHLQCMCGIRIPHSKRRIILAGRLTNHEHTYAIMRKGIKYTRVYTYHTNHSQPLDRYQACVIYR